MVANREVTEINDGVSANRMILRITPLTDGEATGGATRDILVVEGIIGSPEGRALGSPGDVRYRQDVPQVWQKATGQRTTTGWALIAGPAGECPSNVITVGPDCQFETIQPALDFAAALAVTLNRIVVVQVAPGDYTEDLTLRPNVELDAIGRVGVSIIGTATLEDTTGTFVLRNIRMVAAAVADNALVMGGSAVLALLLVDITLDGKFVITNSAASLINMTRCSMLVPDDIPNLTTAITMSGAVAAVLTISYTKILVADRPTNRAIAQMAGLIELSYSEVEGLVAVSGTSTLFMLYVRIDTISQASLDIGAGATVLADNCAFDSNQAGGNVVTGLGTLEFTNLSLPGTAKNFQGGTVVDGSEGYDEAVLANWTGAAPLTIKIALDRIAAALGPIA